MHCEILHLEVTTWCNLRCRHCRLRADWWQRKHMPTDAALRVLDWAERQPRRPHAILQGHGESLTHPEYLRIWTRAADACCGLEFQTNGTLLHPAQTDRLLANARGKWRRLKVSLDGPDQETHETMRPGVQLEDVLQNIAYLMGRAGNPCLTVETVVTTLNLAKIPAMIPLAIDLGADRIQLSALSPWEGVQDIAITQEQFASAIDAARAQACADAIRVEAPAATPAALCPPEQCALPRGVLHVDVDGVVHPCCMLSGVPLGNLTEQTPEQILSGPLRADFLRGMSTHPICGGCPIRRPKV